MNGVRHPLGAAFDEAKPKLRKHVWNSIENERVKSGDVYEFEFRKTGFSVVIIEHGEAAAAGVNANRKIQNGRLLVERKKIRVAEVPVTFQTAHEDAAGAVLFRPRQICKGFIPA